MNPQLKARIEEKDVWTFPECVGLSSEFGIKVRAVIAFIMMSGKTFVEEPGTEATTSPRE